VVNAKEADMAARLRREANATLANGRAKIESDFAATQKWYEARIRDLTCEIEQLEEKIRWLERRPVEAVTVENAELRKKVRSLGVENTKLKEKVEQLERRLVVSDRVEDLTTSKPAPEQCATSVESLIPADAASKEVNIDNSLKVDKIDNSVDNSVDNHLDNSITINVYGGEDFDLSKRTDLIKTLIENIQRARAAGKPPSVIRDELINKSILTLAREPENQTVCGYDPAIDKVGVRGAVGKWRERRPTEVANNFGNRIEDQIWDENIVPLQIRRFGKDMRHWQQGDGKAIVCDVAKKNAHDASGGRTTGLDACTA
jgi:hypothetical protein